MNFHPIAITLALAAFALAPAPATQAAATQPRIMTLSARASVRAKPDMAVIRLGVVREAKTARKALAANNAAMARVIETIRAAGVEEKDIRTSGFSLNPRYVYPKQGSTRPPYIAGYTAANSLAVTVRDLDRLGTILDAVVSAGSNRMNGITFGLENPAPLRDRARKVATAKAIAKAKLYANAAGFTLGPVLSLSERSGPRPPRPVYARAMMKAESAPDGRVPVAGGEQEITVSVTISWKIE